LMQGEKPSSSQSLKRGGTAMGRKSDKDVEVTLVNGVTAVSLKKKYGVVVCQQEDCIGRGATAVVRLAHKLDQDSTKIYAVKEFRKRRKDETKREYIKKLTSEFCISSALHHSNVVETVDFVLDENHNWCEVMEYCAAGDLYSIIKTGHMQRAEIDCCFKQLIQGLEYLHSMGVAHRDIKPENLLMSEHGVLKITDFGVSDVFQICWEQDAHASSGLCGSEPYMAPELFKSKDYDARCVDVWSCGVVYYAMTYKGVLFHRAVYSDSHYASFLEKRKKGTYEPFNRLGEETMRVMSAIMEPDPFKRLAVSEIMESKWFQAIDICVNCKVGDKVHQHFGDDFEQRMRMLEQAIGKSLPRKADNNDKATETTTMTITETTETTATAV